MQMRTWIWGLMACTLAVAGLIGGWHAYASSDRGDGCCPPDCCPPGCCDIKTLGECCPPECCPPDCCEDAKTKPVASVRKTADDCCLTTCCGGSTTPKTGTARSSGCCTK
jgi:hypothetical protein